MKETSLEKDVGVRYTGWHKNGNFWKTQQKLKKYKKKKLTEIEPLQLAF